MESENTNILVHENETEAAAAITITTNTDKDNVQNIANRELAITDLTSKGYILYFINIHIHH